MVEPVLGTRLAMQFHCTDSEIAARAEAIALAECNRLEGVLSAFRPDSAWCRWRDGRDPDPVPEVRSLLALAAHWHRRSGGAFNPAAGVMLARWRRAVAEQRAPSPTELVELASTIAVLPYVVADDGTVERTGDCRHLDLHAIAKGWVVDRAAAALADLDGLEAFVINAGGDLLRHGVGELIVHVEDPRTPFDNAPPMIRLLLREGGVATSSGARRPLVVGGRQYHHVVDPRTGAPAEQTSSASVLAPDAATADVMATVVGVTSVADALAIADSLDGVGCCLLDRDGTLWRSTRWKASELA